MTEQELERIGHYVLGLMESAEVAAFEAEMARSPDLAAAVAKLQSHMQALDDTATPLTANPTLWRQIEARLDTAPTHTGVPTPRAANDNRRSRWMGMAASVLVALGIGYLAGTSMTRQEQPLMIAVLIDEATMQPGAIVEAFADDSVRLVPLERFAVPEGQVLEVWTLPDAETGPVSLGTFDDPATIRLAGPDLPLPADGQLYEITLEPAPRSPIGRPTGPILVKGFAKPPV